VFRAVITCAVDLKCPVGFATPASAFLGSPRKYLDYKAK